MADPEAASGRLMEEHKNTGRLSCDSDLSSVSTTSLVFERINDRLATEKGPLKHAPSHARSHSYYDLNNDDPLGEDANDDLETGPFLPSAAPGGGRMDRGARKVLMIVTGLFIAAWLAGLAVYVSSRSYQHSSTQDHDPQATSSRANLKKMTLDQVMGGEFRPRSHEIRWIAGASGEDGLLLERGASGKDFLVVEDVRRQNPAGAAAVASLDLHDGITLIRNSSFMFDGNKYFPVTVEPSADLSKVLLATDTKSNWRHSSTGLYWIFDVETQTAEPLDPVNPYERIALAQWSPMSDSIVFTRDNNVFLRRLDDEKVIQITTDGGEEVFNGVPDWVYEEEVFFGPSTTWWSADGQYIAFVRADETGVPEYPVQYFVSRPSLERPADGEESYPEVRQIRYPKAGAHNPVVELKFYDVARGEVFSVDIAEKFPEQDRLIIDVMWAGEKVIVRETNRISDVMRVILIDVAARSGKTARTLDVNDIDGGWFEIVHEAQYIPADPTKGRLEDGYVEKVIADYGIHLAYFTPLGNPKPVMLTSGKWEVDAGPASVDLEKNLVYFVGTKESSIQRHVYTVKLDGSELRPFTDTSREGYYGVSFSSGSGFALLTYEGPNIPYQKVVSTPSNDQAYEHMVENNAELSAETRKYDMPLLKYGTLEVDGVELNYLERRPPHFDERKQYPVLFYQYSGPGSQTVSKQFAVDFQAYIAASLGYVVVTVDGRGTGFIGRAARVVVRGQMGHWETHDQIAAGRHWASLPYVDSSRLCIWGWSYGGFMTLKTLEQDHGETFSYGMAVAPVTDFRFYDSIYTERYMRTPQQNPDGYAATAVTNATAIGSAVRFLLMHGVADDNVHMQNSLVLLDALDIARVENYDVHIFPDSDHSISFHGARTIVYDKLNNWLINAFNGEWLKTAHPTPNAMGKRENLEFLRA